MLIVLEHWQFCSLWRTFDWILFLEENPFARDAIEDLIANGAVVFIFISGYLFQHFRPSSGIPLSSKEGSVCIDSLPDRIDTGNLPQRIFEEPVVQYSFWRELTRLSSSLVLPAWWRTHYYPLWFIP